MGRLYLAAGMAVLLVPILLASFLVDITKRKAIVAVALVVLVGGYFVVDNSDEFQEFYWRWSLPAFPPDETAFIAVANELRALRVDPATDARHEAALRQVEARFCALPVEADNWVGQVGQMFLTSSGDGASLAISIWPYLVVRTALFPDDTETLIRAASPVFPQVSGLRQGDVVRFSGRIVGRAGACPNDLPIAPNERLLDPEFIVRLAAVAKEAAY